MTDAKSKTKTKLLQLRVYEPQAVMRYQSSSQGFQGKQ